MKKYFLQLIFIAALTTNLTAQNPLVKQWDKRFGGTNAETFYSIIQINNGDYLLAGNSQSGISGDKSQAGCSSEDYWIEKID